MSRQPPDFDTLVINPDGDKFSVTIKWHIPGPDSTIPGDVPDVFEVFVNGAFHKELPPSETEITIPGFVPGPVAVSTPITVCCSWRSNAEELGERKCSSVDVQVPAKPGNSSSGSGGPASPPAPVIVEVQQIPGTLRQRNHYKVIWHSPGSNHYNYQSGVKGGEHHISSDFREGDIKSNSVVIPNTRPRTRYLFKVEGCFKPTLGKSRCSSWTEAEVITAAPLKSLRQFLDGEDANQGLRSILTETQATSVLDLLRR